MNEPEIFYNETLKIIRNRHSTRMFAGKEVSGSLIKTILGAVNDVLEFFEEPKGAFMAAIPAGYPLKPPSGPKKKPLESTIKYFD